MNDILDTENVTKEDKIAVGSVLLTCIPAMRQKILRELSPHFSAKELYDWQIEAKKNAWKLLGQALTDG